MNHQNDSLLVRLEECRGIGCVRMSIALRHFDSAALDHSIQLPLVVISRVEGLSRDRLRLLLLPSQLFFLDCPFFL